MSSQSTAMDMKELIEQDPLLGRFNFLSETRMTRIVLWFKLWSAFLIIINRSLEMRELRSKRKGAKVSISSVVTEMTQFSEEV